MDLGVTCVDFLFLSFLHHLPVDGLLRIIAFGLLLPSFICPSVKVRIHVLYLTKQWHMNEMKNSNLQSLFSSIASLTSTNNNVDTHIPSFFLTHRSFTGCWCYAHLRVDVSHNCACKRFITSHPCLESAMPSFITNLTFPECGPYRLDSEQQPNYSSQSHHP